MQRIADLTDCRIDLLRGDFIIDLGSQCIEQALDRLTVACVHDRFDIGKADLRRRLEANCFLKIKFIDDHARIDTAGVFKRHHIEHRRELVAVLRLPSLIQRIGLETLQQMRDANSDVAVVIISGHGNIETAVRATKLGAFDFIEKPLSIEKTVLTIRNALRQRQLERMRSVIDYRSAVQSSVLRVKNALREVQTQYALIGQTRVSRIAAAENLRTLLVLEKTIASLSPDFLDLKFRRQEALAAAEVEEILALTNYNIAIAELSSATGRALERNRIRFVVPEGGTYDTGVSEP